MARFLIDEDLPLVLASLLRKKDHVAEHIQELNLRGSTDAYVWSAAQQRQATLVTGDSDFGNIVRFPLGTHFGIVVLQISLGHENAATRDASRGDVVFHRRCDAAGKPCNWGTRTPSDQAPGVRAASAFRQDGPCQPAQAVHGKAEGAWKRPRGADHRVPGKARRSCGQGPGRSFQRLPRFLVACGPSE
jgi:predicted nuclease of predicted toxin-antitoxin system